MCQNANTFIVQTLHGTALLMHFQETVILFFTRMLEVPIVLGEVMVYLALDK